MPSFTSVSARLRQLFRQTRSFIGRPRVVIQQQPVVFDDADVCDRPIFLFGVHRSGTSLTRRVFNSHSEIACPPETFFLQYFANMIRDEDSFHGFAGMGFSREAALRELRRSAQRFHEVFRKAHGKRRWADKTPQYVFAAEEIYEIFGENACYIIIFRHPFDIAVSIYMKNWRFGDFDADLFRNAVLYVKEAHSRLLDFLHSHRESAKELFYEELCQNPEETLKKILEFVGEPWDPGMLEFQSKSHNDGIEDPMVRGTKHFEMNFGSWSQISDAQFTFMEKELGDYARSFGYPVDRVVRTAPRMTLALPPQSDVAIMPA